MGAVQAQEYRLMRWAVAMRTCRPSSKAFKNAFDEGKIVRLHLMRGTWQLLSAEDYWPFLHLCGRKALAVIKGWMSSNRIDIPGDELECIREIIERTAGDLGSITKEDLVQALAERDIVMDDHRLSYHIRMAELAGVLCSGDLLPMKSSYALTSEKIGSEVQTDTDEALMILTRKYFRSRQPATLEDFVWWSGLNITDCRRGMDILGDYLHTVKWKKREFFVTDDCRVRGYRKGRCLLLPPYDEYLISYKSRDLVLSQEYRFRAHNDSGIFQPVIVRDGIICGNWTPFRNGHTADYFIGEHDVSLEDEWSRYLAFKMK